MTVYHDRFKVKSDMKYTFHDITDKTKGIVRDSMITNGIAVVYSQHTTCSIMIQEESHDVTPEGTKFLLQDLLDIFEKIIPICTSKGQYLHPGSEHLKDAKERGELEVWNLNTDAHLRSCLMGRSESIPIVDGNLELGEFGQVYFIDFDSVRERERTVHVQIVGNEETG